MALVSTDWSIDRDTGDIRYTGDDHGGASPSYATVIEFHRWLQDKADDAVASGVEELDITNVDPSRRSTDNIITLINDYNISGIEAEHLYDGSIIQNDGNDIWDGIVNFGNADVQIQLIQNGQVLADDWWNYGGAGLNADATAGISHRFMIKVREGGTDIDNRKLIGICRRFEYTYSEFNINATARGNNVLALTDSDDLNNETASGIVATWTTITNNSVGYNGIDIDNNGTPEYYYSEWDKDTYSINQFYERMKYITRDGETATLYGLPGELFRGITHQVDYGSLAGGTFNEAQSVSWSGASTGTGQIFADDGVDTMWIQLLTGTAPAATASLVQGGVTATVTTLTDRSSTINTPFCGASTGSAIIGAYGFGIEVNDVTAADSLRDLTNTPIAPPNYVQNSVGGLTVSGVGEDSDRVLVAPWDGSTYDSNNDPAIDKDQLSLDVALVVSGISIVRITESIPDDTPSTGTIRVTDDNGFERRLEYSNWENGPPNRFYNITTSDGNEDFSSVNASVGNDVYVSYLDKYAESTTESYTAVQTGTRNLVVIVRNGGQDPVKQFISSWTHTTSAQTINAIKTTDV